MNIKKMTDSEILARMFRTRSWAILTATVEADGAHDCPSNLAATDRLRLLLSGNPDFLVVPVTGRWNGIEQGESFLVFGIGARAACALGEHFRQDCVVTKSGIVECSSLKRTVHFERAELVGPDAPCCTTLPGGACFQLC